MCGHYFLAVLAELSHQELATFGKNKKQENAAQYICRSLLERQRFAAADSILYILCLLPFPPSRAIQINEDSTDMSTSSWENYMYDRKYKTISE
jgi:hypothetical protein